MKKHRTVHLVVLYVKGIWFTFHFIYILSLYSYNERFVFILIHSYLLQLLVEVIRRTLLPVFIFVFGSFSEFMQKVFDILGRGSSLLHKYRTLIVKKWVKAVMFSIV